MLLILLPETPYYFINTNLIIGIRSINFDEIERFYSIYNPSEIIIIHNFDSNQQIENMLTYSVIDCETKHIFKIDDQLPIINRNKGIFLNKRINNNV